jgi:TolB-like protein
MQDEAVALREPSEPLLRVRVFGIFSIRTRDGREVRFGTRKASAVFVYLLMNTGDLVLKSRLERLLWGSRFKQQSSASLRQCLSDMRRTLTTVSCDLLVSHRDTLRLENSLIWIDGVTGRAHPAGCSPGISFLESLKGISQEFDRWIAEQETRLEISVPSIRQSAASRGQPDTTVIAVVPIALLGKPAKLKTLVAGELTQQLAMAISRMRWFKVGIINAERAAGVAYYLTGSLSMSGPGSVLRMTLFKRGEVDLVIWSKTFEAQSDDIHRIGQIASEVAASIDPELIYLETLSSNRKSIEELSFREKFLRAIPLIYAFEFNSWKASEALLRECMLAEPENARIAAYLALSLLTGVAQGWVQSSAPLLEAERFAHLAVTLDPHDSIAHAVFAHILAFSYHKFQDAEKTFARAVSVNPSCGITQMYRSLTLSYMENRVESWDAICAARSALIYDPYWSIIDACESIHNFFCGDIVQTINKARDVLAKRPTFTNIRKILIIALCLESARSTAEEQQKILLEQHPDFSWNEHFLTYPFYKSETRRKCESAVRVAGLYRKTVG